MKLIRRAALAALATTLLFGTTLHAVGEGRVIATLLDEAGAPVSDAKVVVTRAGTNYKLEKESDKKGQVTLLILDATQIYQVRVEKDGYTPYEGPLDPKPDETMRLTFTLAKAVPQVVEQAPPEPTAKDKAILAYNAGVTALKGGDMAGAVPRFQEAVSLEPSLAEAHVALAEVYLEMKRNGEALASADRYLALKPGDARGLKARYDALKAAGDEEKAKEALAALAAAAPANEDTVIRFFNSGAEAARNGNLEEAARSFQKVIELAPNQAKFAKAYYVVGLNLVKDDSKKAQAKQYLETFLQLAPNDPDAKTAKDMLEYLK